MAGTAGYMSPEQATGGKVDARSDVFSFGSVLYEMVTGQRAFSGETRVETLAAVMKEQPKSPSELVPGVPPELERVILRCLRKEPERRFQHMMDVKVELQEIKEESDSAAVATPPVAGPRSASAWAVAGLAASRPCWPSARWPPGSGSPAWPRCRHRASSRSPRMQRTRGGRRRSRRTASRWHSTGQGREADNRDIYVKMIGSSELHRLTTDPAFEAASELVAGWPTHRVRAVVSGTAAIHIVSPLGGSEPEAERLARRPGALSWSPRRSMAGCSARPLEVRDGARGRRHLASVPVEGGEPRHGHAASAGRGRLEAPCVLPGRASPGLRCMRHAPRPPTPCDVHLLDLGPDFLPSRLSAPPDTAGVFRSTGMDWARDGALASSTAPSRGPTCSISGGSASRGTGRRSVSRRPGWGRCHRPSRLPASRLAFARRLDARGHRPLRPRKGRRRSSLVSSFYERHVTLLA